ncbi:hypothetical protein P5673_021469 [Acropora cervicornis]|uniref:Uncharacterized protein n=1 Tax=Acropora cervicornis TaxID=6130 RepID=A0AAD9Q886_ACRCE|nr:hypothetical protein P5673_021469 [Acropora cervicornis]
MSASTVRIREHVSKERPKFLVSTLKSSNKRQEPLEFIFILVASFSVSLIHYTFTGTPSAPSGVL